MHLGRTFFEEVGLCTPGVGPLSMGQAFREGSSELEGWDSFQGEGIRLSREEREKGSLQERRVPFRR